ncbi:YkgJ family cysteine cluster protein [Chloroflexota bacterium]
MQNWKDSILNDRPRLSPDSKFKYSCHKGLSCFGRCCGDVNIFLTPYDVLRMKKALGLSSEEFLGKHTLPLILQDQQIPVALLKMGDDENKKCHFVTTEGCTIYQDRPWACRMYPLGLASSKAEAEGEEFCFMADDESLCLGFKEDKEWTVKEWLDDQGVDIYNQKSQDYMQFTLHKSFQDGKELGPTKVQMFYQTCYNLDKFRESLFTSSFFERFDIKKATLKKLKTDDEALLDFGIKWLRFALFAENTIKVKDKVWDKKKDELGFTTE